MIGEMKLVKEGLKESDLKETMITWSLMLQVPNIPDMSVPDGMMKTIKKLKQEKKQI